VSELLIIDEAERLTPTALEPLRDQHDRTHLAMILIGMPGIDERFRHYPSSTAASDSHTTTGPLDVKNFSSS
jgi:DNA transposition AAA+ family ATPase